MKKRIYIYELDCYKVASEEQIQRMRISPERYFNLEGLPSEELAEKLEEFIWERGKMLAPSSMASEVTYYNNIREFLIDRKIQSLDAREEEKIIRMLKGWMLERGYALSSKKYRPAYDKIGIESPSIVRHMKKILKFLEEEDGRDEQEKDIWTLKNFDFPIYRNPIKNTETINFTKIVQPDIREEVKKAIYHHLKTEALGSIKRELSAMNKFSKYLDEKHSKISTCEEIDREIIEQFLINIKVESNGGNGIRDDLLKLRNVLETIGKIYDFPHLTKLFLKSDFPPERKAEFKSYSDSELKRLNAQIVKMEEQIARAMIIHQMLGTRISDTLTLRKTRRYEKPISRELAQLIGKAVSYANEHYPESIYIFADENKPERPISYQTLQDKVLRMIYEKDIRDDSGKLFGFGTHMFRHCYGVKLTELHVDDWTIAKLLGHKGVRSVQYYRKMSNQRMADETREVRNFMSQIILASLDGWGEEYEQIRQDAGIE